MKHLGLQICLSCSLVRRDITVLKEQALLNNFHALLAPITLVSSLTAKTAVYRVRQDITVQMLDLKNLQDCVWLVSGVEKAPIHPVLRMVLQWLFVQLVTIVQKYRTKEC